MERDRLCNLKLAFNSIHKLSTLSAVQDFVDKHATVFTEKPGILKGTEVKLHVDPQVQSQIFKACPVPFANKAQVETRLENLSIIIPVQHPNWAALVVPVMK